jgi:hypothetical protein
MVVSVTNNSVSNNNCTTTTTNSSSSSSSVSNSNSSSSSAVEVCNNSIMLWSSGWVRPGPSAAWLIFYLSPTKFLTMRAYSALRRAPPGALGRPSLRPAACGFAVMTRDEQTRSVLSCRASQQAQGMWQQWQHCSPNSAHSQHR